MISANLGSGVETIGSHCFEKCQSLQALNLPQGCQTIGDYAFATSRALHDIRYAEYERDPLDGIAIDSSLDHIGSGVIANTPTLTDLVLPASITSIISQASSTAFQQASLTSLTFLGMTTDGLITIQPQLASTQMLGLSSDCEIVASDGKKLKYTNAGGSLVIDESFSIYGKARIYTGKLNRLKLGKTLYWFTEDLYQWCMDPSKQDPEKFPKPTQCPFIVFYGDFLTSKKTKMFLRQILENEDFQTWIKDSLKCFLFLVDRNGCISSGRGNSDLQFFRNVHRQMAGVEDFVAVDFFYGSNFWSTTLSSGSFDDLKRIVSDGMDRCNFKVFDSTQYEYALDVLDPETIPSSGADSSQIKLWCGAIPWWFNGTSAVKGVSRKLSTEKFNFQVLSTPETTYLLVGAYDERNPSSFPAKIKTETASVWKPYADTFKELYNRDCTGGGFTALFEEAPQYRHFICFEFSHGANKLITIDSKLTYSKIWQVLKDCKGKVFMMFDSCDSGSMFQAKRSLATSGEARDQQEDVGVATYLVQKLQRRSHLMKALFGVSTEDVDPQIICWSSTTSTSYGWYYPRSDTVWAAGLRRTNSRCQGQRYLPTFLVNKEEGFRAYAAGDCIPQRKSYQTKNGVQIIGECSWNTDNGIEIDAEKCIIWT